MASSIDASTSGAGGVITTADNTGVLQLKTAGTTAVTVDASQNVGIGTTSPANKLDVSSSVGTRIQVTSTGTSTYPGFTIKSGSQAVFEISQSASDGVGFVYNTANSPILFGTNNTERMRIDSSGNLLVGTTSSFGSYTRLSAQAPDTLVAIGAYRATTSTGYDIQQFRSDVGGTNTIKYAVYANGTAGAVSDVTKKKNIESARNYLNDLQSIRVVKYNWNTDDDSAPKELGFIAQEVETVFPGMVATTEDGTKILKKEVFVPMLIKAIQEQQTIINDLKARIEALEAK